MLTTHTSLLTRPTVKMKVAVMQVALTVLGLVASSFAAPAVDGVSKQMNSRSEPVCIDMWQNPGRKDPIRLNVSKIFDFFW